jgi:predicted metalloendopeptidase
MLYKKHRFTRKHKKTKHKKTARNVNAKAKANTTNIKRSKNKTQKRCYNDNEIIRICKTGHFTKTSDEGLYNEANLARFDKMTEKLNAIKKYKKLKIPFVEYTAFLMDTFKAHSNSKEETALIKSNFYGYVNDSWLKETEMEIEDIPKFYVQFDTFRIVQEKVYYQLIDYMKTYIKSHPQSDKALAIKNVYDSMHDDTTKTTRLQAQNISVVLTQLIANGDMYSLLAYINSNEIVSWGAPIIWQQMPDEKNVSKYISHLSPVQLGLYDYMLYIDDPKDDKESKTYKKFIKKKYLNYIRETFKACLGDDQFLNYDPNDIWEVELQLLDAMGCTPKFKENPDFYNVVTAAEVETKLNFDWDTFARSLGFKTPPKKIIVSDLNAVRCITQLLKEKWNTTQWKTYWLFLYFRQMIRFEDTFRNIHFNFYNNLLEGQPVIMPSEIYPIYALSMTFNTFLTEEYVSHNYNQLYVNYVNHLANDL